MPLMCLEFYDLLNYLYMYAGEKDNGRNNESDI